MNDCNPMTAKALRETAKAMQEVAFEDAHPIAFPARLEETANWLRKKEGLHISISFVQGSNVFVAKIQDMFHLFIDCDPCEFGCPASTVYDTALENAVNQCIKIIKKKYDLGRITEVTVPVPLPPQHGG